MSKLRVLAYFVVFFAFNIYVFADDLSFTRSVTCETGRKMLIDHHEGSEFPGEDYCAENKDGLISKGVVPAACPKFDRKALRKSLINNQFSSIEKYGRSIQNVVDRLIRSLDRKNRLTYDKLKHLGRDTCVVTIGTHEIQKFLPLK